MTLAPEHAELNEQLNAYLDRALDEPLRRRVTAHLTACQVCREDIAQLRATRDAVRQLPALRAPRPFTLPVPAATPVMPAGLPPWAQQPSAPHTPAVQPPRALNASLLSWTWRLGGLGATICLLISLATFAAPPSRLALTGAADTAERAASAPAPAPPESLARPVDPSTSSAASSGQQGQQGAAPALADRDSSQRVAAATPSGRPGVPHSPAPASDGILAIQPDAAPSAATRATPWLALAIVLALASAGLFALDRRAGARAGVR